MKLKRHEKLLFAAIGIGFLLGTLIKNYRWGLLIGITLTAIYAFRLSGNRRRPR